MLESFYLVGLEKKYFAKMGLNFSVNNKLSLSSGKIFFDPAELKSAEEIFNSVKSPALLARKLTDRFLLLSDSYERFLKLASKAQFDSISHNDFCKLYTSHLEHVYSLIPYSFVISM